MLASIQLEKYYISKIDFSYSEIAIEDESKEKINFAHSFEYLEENKIAVSIKCDIEDKSGLELGVSMVGFFSIKIAEGDEEEEEIRIICERNTLAILFPYLRSAVSDISLKANISPIILPTLNIIALLEDADYDEQNEDEY